MYLLNEIGKGKTPGDLFGQFPGGEEAFIATKVMEAVHISAETGETVTI